MNTSNDPRGVRRVKPTRTDEKLHYEISRRKRLEEDLNEAQDRLERRVLERTAGLAALNETLRHEISDRERAEQALQRSHDYLQSVIDAIPTPVFVKDTKGVFQLVNKSYEILHRRSKEEVIGRTVYDLYPPRLADKYNDMDQALFRETNDIQKYEFETITSQGQIRDVVKYKSALFDRDNQCLGLVGAIFDITDRKRAEEALRESEEKFRNIIEASPMGIQMFEIGPDGRLIFTGANPAAGDITGKSPRESINRVVTGPLPPLDGSGSMQKFRDTALKGRPWQSQQIRTTEEGRVESAYEIHAFQTSPGKMVTMFLDITESKQAEQALIRAKEEWERTFDAVPDLICILDTDYCLVRANTALTRRLGVEANRVIGRTCREVFRCGRESCRVCPLGQLLATGTEHVHEMSLGFSPAEFWVSASPLRGQDGELAGSVLIARDITERKRAEEDLRRARDELEIRVRERTAELAAKNKALKHEIAERRNAEKAVKSRLQSLTHPGRAPENISFTDLFTVDELQTIQDAFADATNLASIITHPDGRPITKPSNFCRLCRDIIRPTPKGCVNCMRSDALIGRPNPEGPNMQPCLSGGLWDGGASICVGDKHIANWLIGQVRDESMVESQMMKYAREIGANEEEFLEALSEVPVMTREQFADVCQALFLIANQMSQLALQNIQQARAIVARQKGRGSQAQVRGPAAASVSQADHGPGGGKEKAGRRTARRHRPITGRGQMRGGQRSALPGQGRRGRRNPGGRGQHPENRDS